MRLGSVVAPVARVNFGATREAEPAVTAPVVDACAPVRQRLTRPQAQTLLFPAWAGGRDVGRELAAGRIRKELDVWQGKGEAGVALAADVGRRLAAD